MISRRGLHPSARRSPNTSHNHRRAAGHDGVVSCVFARGRGPRLPAVCAHIRGIVRHACDADRTKAVTKACAALRGFPPCDAVQSSARRRAPYSCAPCMPSTPRLPVARARRGASMRCRRLCDHAERARPCWWARQGEAGRPQRRHSAAFSSSSKERQRLMGIPESFRDMGSAGSPGSGPCPGNGIGIPLMDGAL